MPNSILPADQTPANALPSPKPTANEASSGPTYCCGTPSSIAARRSTFTWDIAARNQ